MSKTPFEHREALLGRLAGAVLLWTHETNAQANFHDLSVIFIRFTDSGMKQYETTFRHALMLIIHGVVEQPGLIDFIDIPLSASTNLVITGNPHP
jgi:hypothetical protein